MPGRRRRARGGPDGWLVIDKPAGITSAAVCNRIRRLANGARTGHGGTLDPMATGVLPIALGEATKTVPFAVDTVKLYRFTVRWGEERDSDDLDGTTTGTSPYRPDEASIRAALPALTGSIMQVPPRFSAVKVAGRRAYALARAGGEPDLAPRPAEILRLTLEDIPDADHAVFEAETGKGVYVRAITRDLARSLGAVGHVSALRRLRVGPFAADGAKSLDDIGRSGQIGPFDADLLPLDSPLVDIPALSVTEEEAATLRNGQALRLYAAADLPRVAELRNGSTLRVRLDGRPVAVAKYQMGTVRAVRVFNPQ